jgi:hypothetical protein
VYSWFNLRFNDFFAGTEFRFGVPSLTLTALVLLGQIFDETNWVIVYWAYLLRRLAWDIDLELPGIDHFL